MKPVDWVILAAVLIAVAAAVLLLARRKKRGQACGCGCSDCAACGLCAKKDDPEQKKADKTGKA